MIEYSDFTKLDLRVGSIKVCEKIPKSKHLYRLQVDCGEKNLRQIITGISKFYSSEELVDKKIVVLTNLKPKNIMGLESHGMILAADHNGEPFLLKIDERNGKIVPIGSTIK
ncbi:MAG: methionine--tRNA ligase subunit beta [Candidatus Lokiarchaeota archaeon]|nr:methionine--tRNA ligase subunit beta [Candidatus Lokiarchaeota archaeon]